MNLRRNTRGIIVASDYIELQASRSFSPSASPILTRTLISQDRGRVTLPAKLCDFVALTRLTSLSSSCRPIVMLRMNRSGGCMETVSSG